MNWANYDDVLNQLKAFGLDVSILQADTIKQVRCNEIGSKKKNAGWYQLHTFTLDSESYLVGTYGIWQGTDPNTQKIELSKTCNTCKHEMAVGLKICPKCKSTDIKKRELSDDQKQALKAQIHAQKKQQELQIKKQHDQASKIASAAWAQLASEGASGYIAKKNISAPADVKYGTGQLMTFDFMTEHGEKEVVSFNEPSSTLFIPMRNISGAITGLQMISSDKTKFFNGKQNWPKGHELKASFFKIGAPTNIVLVAEGFATGMSLYLATGLQVIVAFNAGNMLPVAQAIHKKNPRLKMLFCADDDHLVTCKAKVNEKQCLFISPAGTATCPACESKLRPGHVGKLAAEAAALAVGGAWVLPQFPAEHSKEESDFNDLANFDNCSLATVANQIDEKLSQLGWALQAPRAEIIAKGEGEAAFSRKDAVSIMSLDDAVERFVPLDDGTGEYVFDTWTRKIAKKKQMEALLEAGIRGDDIKRHWQWQSRGAYYLDEIGFDPTNKDKRVKLNTWTGWEMTPKAGACNKILQTLEYLCSKEANGDDIVEWLVKWMAYPLQNPGAKMGSAIILHGPQGTGKSLIFRVLASIYGTYATVIGNRGLEDKFNADWADSKLFILAEEVATTTDKLNIKNELKELVTGETVRVNAKFSTAYSQKNQMNMAFLSNEDQPLILENDDRRHLVIYTPECLPESHYVAALEERDNGGIEAFYHFLMNLDLTGFSRHTRPPQTHAKQNLIALSLPSEKRFIKEWVDGETEWPCVPCKSMSLYACYIKWCKENGEPWPRPSNKFLGMIANMTGWQLTLKRIYADLHFTGASSPAKLVIPPMQIKVFANGQDQEKQLYQPNEGGLTDSQWLTGYVIDFENAKND